MHDNNILETLLLISWYGLIIPIFNNIITWATMIFFRLPSLNSKINFFGGVISVLWYVSDRVVPPVCFSLYMPCCSSYEYRLTRVFKVIKERCLHFVNHYLTFFLVSMCINLLATFEKARRKCFLDPLLMLSCKHFFLLSHLFFALMIKLILW